MDRFGRPRDHQSAIAMSSSPAQGSLVHHSVPSHMDRSALLALQSAYSNPQMEDDYRVGSAESDRSSTVTMLPASVGVSSHLARSHENYFRSSGSMDDSVSSPLGRSASRRVDPTPLLAVDEPPAARTGSVSRSSSDPHKPLRRWLFDFPEKLDRFFEPFDTVVTRFVQYPLATVGGLTTSLEEEILESNEMTNQQRRDVEEHRRTHSVNTPPPSEAHSHRRPSQSMVLQRSLAITWGNKAMVGLALVYTALTTIEIGVLFPLFLFLSGWDELATLQLLTTSLTALGSQCFKRFVWRQRPWMQGRAIQVKRDKTSSFPSRAVVCAVVYAYGFSHLFFPPGSVPVWLYSTLVVFFSLGAAISRIFVGAHFASDCLVGFLLGAAFCGIGSGLSAALQTGCSTCYPVHNCYAHDLAHEATFASFFSLDMVTMGIISGISVLCVGLAMSSPLQFWTKCTSIFGILFPCFAFRLVMLCPLSNPGRLALLRVDRDLQHPTFVFFSVLITVGALVFTKLLSKLTVVETTVQLATESQTIEEATGRDDMPSGGDLSSHSFTYASASRSDVEERVGLGHTVAESRHFLQFSSLKTTAWNLSIYFIAYTSVFVVLLAWRIKAVHKVVD